MDLRRKLARLSGAGPGAAPPRPPEPPADPAGAERRDRVSKLQAMIGKLISDGRSKLRDRAPPPEPIPLPGETTETAHGPLHRTLSWLEPRHCHGKIPIAGALEVSPITIAKLALDDELAQVDPRGALFLDTETTGLAGGTGTIPFLVGMAWFEDQSLRIEQLILRKPGEEVPLLRRLAEVIEGKSCIVTYNGKAFDWPLLRNRFVLSRVPVAVPRAHLDLLPCARRIYKRRLGQVRLVHLEEQVLGLRRERDIDGAEIPSRFWDFVRLADGSLLAPVIEHNAHDLIALCAILISLAERFDELRPEHEPADQLGVAQLALRVDDHDRADRWARAAADGGGPSDVTVDALGVAATVARKRGAHRAREQLLLRALDEAEDAPRRARLHLELAKLYEHRVRDLDRALHHARHAWEAEGDEARDRRVARLERKIEKRGPLLVLE
ncbi:MAG: ribonuclease H-like domain-containing protein [Sandaracinaceae bacterium]|nr:ribonuclease H-like domain-containing protein [Sandaracinaceae bacterium]